MKKEKDFSWTTYVEAKTGGGQFLGINCRSEDKEKIIDMLKDIDHIEFPATKEISIGHGAYGRYSRYDIKKRKYAGGCSGYIEVLEIKNPPEGRCGNVIHEYNSGESIFYEFRTIGDARMAFENSWSSRRTGEKIKEEPGFIRSVICGYFSPWFYAVADQALFGDFVFPMSICIDHPVYRFGKQFVTKDYEGCVEVKTCVAVTQEKYESVTSGEDRYYLTIWFSDGTSWSEYGGSSFRPRVLEKEELWIQEAVDAFEKTLSEEISEFSVHTGRRKVSVRSETERDKSNFKIKIIKQPRVEIKPKEEDEYELCGPIECESD